MSGRISPLNLEDFRGNLDLIMELAFPAKDRDYSLMILRELEEIGVDAIYVEFLADSLRIAFIGKGYRGIVIKGKTRGLDVAIKILRTNTAIRDLSKEAKATEMANSVGVGPKLLGYSRHVLVLEYVEGIGLGKWINGLAIEEVHVLKNVLRRCFLQARSLDVLGLDHGELSDARKHVIIRSNLDPVIIDFGKARIRDRPSNVTSFFSHIAFGPHSEKIMQMLGIREPPVDASRNYKRRFDEESFAELMKRLNLQ